MTDADSTRRPTLRVVPDPSGASSPDVRGLPARRGHLLGRAAELATVVEHLGSARLVTIVGTGGVGKTRLAIEAARRTAATTGRPVQWVGLAPVADPALVLPTIAAAAGWTDPGDRAPADLVAAAIGDDDLLLVLDNLEHLAGCESDLMALVAACPRLTLLTTSRAALRVTAEQVVRLAPFDVPTTTEPTALATHPAVALLSGSAERAGFDLAVTTANAEALVRLCRRLDGLPLALELAGARLGLIEPGELTNLLADRDDVLRRRERDAGEPHQRTLRATVAWSLDLLGPVDRERFARLGVFRGDFTVGAAAAVVDADVAEVLDTFQELTELHLVRSTGATGDEPRFDLLETLRTAALAELAATGGETSARRAHARYHLAAVVTAAAELTGGGQTEAAAAIDRQLDDVRDALTFLIDNAAADDARTLAAALWRYWWVRGLVHEGATWLDRALALPGGAPGPRAAALRAAGELAEETGRLDHAETCYREAAALLDEIGDRVGLATIWNGLGLVARMRGDLEAAEPRHRRALAVFREVGDRRSEATALNNLAAVAYFRGDLAAAADLWSSALLVVEELHDLRSCSMVLSNIGAARLGLGDVAAAIDVHRRAAEMAERLGDRGGIARSLMNLGEAHLAAGDTERAEPVLVRGAVLGDEIGEPNLQAVAAHNLGLLAGAVGRVGDAVAHHRTSLRQIVRHDLGHALPSVVEQLAVLAAELGETPIAGTLFATARARREHDGSRPPDIDLDELRRWSEIVATAGPAAPVDDPELLEVVDRLTARTTGLVRVTGEPDDPGPLRTLGLTAREAEIVPHLVARRTDQEIAAALFVSVRTVTTHVSAILRKLQVTSRREVAAALAARGLGDLADPRRSP